MKRALMNSIGGLLALTIVVASTGHVAAATMEQALAQCKEQVTPIVRECVRQKMGGQRGNPEQYIPGCKSAVTGQMNACVGRAIFNLHSPVDSIRILRAFSHSPAL